MTILELLQGYHPFRRSDGGWLTDGEVGPLVANEPVPIDDSAVDDR